MYSLPSPWLWHPVFLSGDIYNRGPSRLGYLHVILILATSSLWLSWAYYQKEMSWRICPYGMDTTAIWHGDRLVSEFLDVMYSLCNAQGAAHIQH